MSDQIHNSHNLNLCRMSSTPSSTASDRQVYCAEDKHYIILDITGEKHDRILHVEPLLIKTFKWRNDPEKLEWAAVGIHSLDHTADLKTQLAKMAGHEPPRMQIRKKDVLGKFIVINNFVFDYPASWLTIIKCGQR